MAERNGSKLTNLAVRQGRPKAAFRTARECSSAALAILYLAGAPVSYAVTIEGSGEVLFCRVSVLVYTYR